MSAQSTEDPAEVSVAPSAEVSVAPSPEAQIEYVLPVDGIELLQLQKIIEFLINHPNKPQDPQQASSWWVESDGTFLNSMTLGELPKGAVPDKTENYLTKGGRYNTGTDHGQRYGNVRWWTVKEIGNRETKEPEVPPYLKVTPTGDDRYSVTIINQEEDAAKQDDAAAAAAAGDAAPPSSSSSTFSRLRGLFRRRSRKSPKAGGKRRKSRRKRKSRKRKSKRKSKRGNKKKSLKKRRTKRRRRR